MALNQGGQYLAANNSVAAPELLARFTENLRWAKSHPDQLGQHRGHFVVVLNGGIVFSSTSELRAQARAKKSPGAYVTYVSPEQLAWIL